MSPIGLNGGMLMTMNGLQNKDGLKDGLEIDEPQREQRSLLNRRSSKRWLSVLRVILVVAAALAGNNAFRRALVFECEDPGRGIAFEIRGNWEVRYVERNGTYLLNRRRFIRRPSGTIVVWTYPRITDAVEPDKTPHDLEALMEDRIEIWRRDRESFTLIQATSIAERGDYRIATATVLVGKLTDPEDACCPWMLGEELYLADIYMISTIRDDEPDHTIPFGSSRLDHNMRLASVYVVRSSRAKVNAEAEEIVNSFRFIEYNVDPFRGSDLACR